MKLETFFDFCSGIGAGRLGLEYAGMKCVGYSDTSRLASRTYQLLHNTENEKNYGNLKKINGNSLPAFDLLIAGFPCQTFSVIGRQEGFSDDRGQIIFHLARILRETQPKCFILENVKGLVTHDGGKTLQIILKELNNSGYDIAYKVLSSIDYGVPQMRQRVYFIGIHHSLKKNIYKFKWPTPIKKPALMDFLLDDNIASDERLRLLQYYLNNPTNQGKYTISDIEKMERKIIDTRMSDLRIYDGRVPTLRAHRDGILYVKNGKIYQLTGYEALLLQGFPLSYADKVKNNVSDRHLLMQAGNAMTVNVIAQIGNSLQTFLKEDTTMTSWQDFELECYQYLCRTYGDVCKFNHFGKSDSTKPDIGVDTQNDSFFIEVKKADAQSGQFVLLPNECNKTFIFSPKNKTTPNEFTDIITRFMNKDFDKFNNAGTAGEKINIDKEIFSQWIIDYYKSKNVKYVITCGHKHIIFPIEKFADYFDITASYREKKSGSGELSKKYYKDVLSKLNIKYPSIQSHIYGKKLFVNYPDNISGLCFIHDDKEIYLSDKGNGEYEVRQLSKTRNKNVIFSLSLKKEQAEEDLAVFKKHIHC